MSIIAEEIKRYKATVNNDTSGNGGRMSTNLITSGVRNAVFPNVSESERTSGITRWRKVFIKIANDDDLTFYNTKVHLTTTTGADDYIVITSGTQTNIQSDLSSPRIYGCGTLGSNITSGASTLTVSIEGANSTAWNNLNIFNTSTADNIIWIGDGTNNEYFEEVSASKTNNVYTLTLKSGDTVTNNYSTTNTYIASCINTGDIACSFDSVVVTSASGTFNTETFPILLDNIGTVYDSWTILFTNATTYTITGLNEGTLSSGGNISSNASPINSAFAKKYFTIQSGAFGGTFASGDMITFKTYPAAIPLWIREIVPANSASYANNTWTERIVGESA